MVIRTTADNRKDVVNAISGFTGIKAVYMGPPSFAFQIGDIMVKRDGSVETMEEKMGERINNMLIEKGMAESEADLVEVKIPIGEHTGVSLKNLVFMLHSKQCLLNRSLQRNAFLVNEKLVSILSEKEPATREEFMQLLNESGGNEANRGFYLTDDAIVFDGYSFSDDGIKMKAYAELSALMCSCAMSHSRVNPRETIEDNEKYYMRVWLIRLGLGGKKGADTRKVLLQNLKGNTAFRTQEEIERAKEKAKGKKKSATELLS